MIETLTPILLDNQQCPPHSRQHSTWPSICTHGPINQWTCGVFFINGHVYLLRDSEHERKAWKQNIQYHPDILSDLVLCKVTLQGAGLLMSVELRPLSNRRAQTPAAVDCNSSKKTAALGESRPPILLRNDCCNHLALWVQGHKNIKMRMG